MNQNIKNEITRMAPTLQGWCSPEKAIAMAELILETDAVFVVEIGVFGGSSLIPQAMALRAKCDGIIYGIDPWKREPCLEGENDKANDEWWSKVDLAEIRKGCEEAVRENGLLDHVILLPMSSSEAAKTMPAGAIEILHIDGNHSELASCRDAELYLPLVRQGGYIWFDDANWPTTQKALSYMAQHCEVVRDLVVKKGDQTLNHVRLFQKR